jgi:hypothetical protein
MIFKNYYDYFIIFIISLKLVYYFIYFSNFILDLFGYVNHKIFIYSENFKIYLDIIFNCSMAILLLYLFNPFTKNIKIDFVVKELLFLYAFILLFKNFENYVNEDKVVKILQNIFFN